ncbi:hypothetical protein [Methylobacterium soli]|uniref:Uncharacterized protein n=1 Tax=Methylobacterium soli TaxID=553447 RepID=A0A6L3SYJ6_9HYPH|nr:hypothetical protein [Methylobacterium soli]KAB1078337.1 hypothetical protein F6X53_14675 [Methylobacterium soli]
MTSAAMRHEAREAAVAGRKLFSNRSSYAIAVTLVIRASDDPRHQAGVTEFRLNAGETRWEDYGNAVDIYLNGIKLVASFSSQLVAQQYLVIGRGSPLDNALNCNNGVDFSFRDYTFLLSTRQVSWS